MKSVICLYHSADGTHAELMVLTQEVARQVLSLAHTGLQRRGLGEEKYLQPLDHFVKTGQNAADVLLEKFKNEWHESVDPCYSAEYSF